jgi:hypothetical protein
MSDLKKREEPGLLTLRDAVVEELTGQFANDRITMEEFERRVEAANSARTRVGLESLIADLAPLPSKKPQKVAEENLPYRVNRGTVPDASASVAIFSGTERRGAWVAPKNFVALSIFGGSKIDLREAELPPDGMAIDVLCLFGGTDIIIPEGVNIVVQGFGLFGGFSRRAPERHYPGAPTITVRGLALFGGAEVKTGRPGAPDRSLT